MKSLPAVYYCWHVSCFLIVAFFSKKQIAQEIDGFKDHHHHCIRRGNGKITAAMIADTGKEKKTPDELRLLNYVMNFTSAVFADVKLGYPIEFKYWPPIYSKDCNQEREGWDKGRGSNLAHKEAWDHFVRHSTNCEDILIVFEYDAFIGRESAGKSAIEFVEKRNVSTDILYFGYCYQTHNDHPSISHLAPYCLHAYALTVHGARKLLEYVDACSIFADAAVALLINKKKIIAEYMTLSWDPEYLTRRFNNEGIRWSGDFEYDGAIPQVKLIPLPRQFKEGDIACVTGSKTVYYFTKNTWRVVPNMDVFVALGLEGHRPDQITTWQLNHYPIGSEITSSSVDKVKKHLKAGNTDP